MTIILIRLQRLSLLPQPLATGYVFIKAAKAKAKVVHNDRIDERPPPTTRYIQVKLTQLQSLLIYFTLQQKSWKNENSVPRFGPFFWESCSIDYLLLAYCCLQR